MGWGWEAEGQSKANKDEIPASCLQVRHSQRHILIGTRTGQLRDSSHTVLPSDGCMNRCLCGTYTEERR